MISRTLGRGAGVRGMSYFQGTKRLLQLFTELLCEDRQEKTQG